MIDHSLLNFRHYLDDEGTCSTVKMNGVTLMRPSLRLGLGLFFVHVMTMVGMLLLVMMPCRVHMMRLLLHWCRLLRLGKSGCRHGEQDCSSNSE
jgi:hypothetical protein